MLGCAGGVGVVLGRAVAHETGHLDDYGFSAQQASDMRAAAEARGPVVK